MFKVSHFFFQNNDHFFLFNGLTKQPTFCNTSAGFLCKMTSEEWLQLHWSGQCFRSVVTMIRETFFNQSNLFQAPRQSGPRGLRKRNIKIKQEETFSFASSPLYLPHYLILRAQNRLQPIRSTVKIWVVTSHQYGIYGLVPDRCLFTGKIPKCQVWSVQLWICYGSISVNLFVCWL